MRFKCVILLAALALNISCAIAPPLNDADFQEIMLLLEKDTRVRYAAVENCTAFSPEDLCKIKLTRDSAIAKYVVKFESPDAARKAVKREAKLVKIGGNWVIAFNREIQ